MEIKTLAQGYLDAQCQEAALPTFMPGAVCAFLLPAISGHAPGPLHVLLSMLC